MGVVAITSDSGRSAIPRQKAPKPVSQPVAETTIPRKERTMSTETTQMIGYARVSRADQDPQLQIDALKRAGCAKIFIDHMSGSQMERPQLSAALEYLRQGDTLVLWKMDRAGRNTRGVLELVEDLTRRGIGLRSITEQISTTGPMGKAILTVMLAFGTLERDVLIERTRAGLDAARAQGRVGGRPTVVSAHKLSAARSLILGGATVTAAAAAVSVSRSSLYRGLARQDATMPNGGRD
jgi:DNA invertase Pin-like site-specific DNA recombinase